MQDLERQRWVADLEYLVMNMGIQAVGTGEVPLSAVKRVEAGAGTGTGGWCCLGTVRQEAGYWADRKNCALHCAW